MKKNIAIFAIVILLNCYIVVLPTYAAPATSSAERIKELKESVATVAAKLKKDSKKVFSGEIKTLNENGLVLTQKNGSTKTVLFNEETIFYRSGVESKTKINLKNLAVGNQVSAFGNLTQNSLTTETKDNELLAKIIIVRTKPLNLNGKVTEVSVNDGTLTVQTPKNGSYIIDVETTTKIFIYDKETGLSKLTLSKIKAGDRVHINGFSALPKSEENRVTANRILVLPGKAIGIVATPSAFPKSSPTPK